LLKNPSAETAESTINVQNRQKEKAASAARVNTQASIASNRTLAAMQQVGRSGLSAAVRSVAAFCPLGDTAPFKDGPLLPLASGQDAAVAARIADIGCTAKILTRSNSQFADKAVIECLATKGWFPHVVVTV
jgi:hypothetical protein